MKNKILFLTIFLLSIFFWAGTANADFFTFPAAGCQAYNSSGTPISHAYPGEYIHFSLAGSSNYITAPNYYFPWQFSWSGVCNGAFSSTLPGGSETSTPPSCYTSANSSGAESLTVSDSATPAPNIAQLNCSSLTVDDPLTVSCPALPDVDLNTAATQNITFAPVVAGGYNNTYSWTNYLYSGCTNGSSSSTCNLSVTPSYPIGEQAARVIVTSADGQQAYADCSVTTKGKIFWTVDYSISSLTLPSGPMTYGSDRLYDTFYYQLADDSGNVVDEVSGGSYIFSNSPHVTHTFAWNGTGSLHPRIKIYGVSTTSGVADENCNYINGAYSCYVVADSSIPGAQTKCCELGGSFYDSSGLCGAEQPWPSCSVLDCVGPYCQPYDNSVPPNPPNPQCRNIYSQYYEDQGRPHPWPDDCAYNYQWGAVGNSSCNGTSYLGITCDSHADDGYNYLYSGQSYSGVVVNISAPHMALGFPCTSGIYNSSSHTVSPSSTARAGVDTLGFWPHVTGTVYDPLTFNFTGPMYCNSATYGICQDTGTGYNSSPNLFPQKNYFYVNPNNEGWACTYIFYNGTYICDPAFTCPAVGSVWPPVSASCSSSPNPVYAGQTLTFNASASGGNRSYGYSWLNTDGTPATNPISNVTSGTTYSEKVVAVSGSAPYQQFDVSDTCSATVQATQPSSPLTICGQTGTAYCPTLADKTAPSRAIIQNVPALFDVGPVSQPYDYSPYRYAWTCGAYVTGCTVCNSANNGNGSPTCMITTLRPATGTNSCTSNICITDIRSVVRDNKQPTADSRTVVFPYRVGTAPALTTACSTIVAGTTNNPSCSAAAPVAVASTFGQHVSLIVTPSGGNNAYAYSWTGSDTGAMCSGAATSGSSSNCTEPSLTLGNHTRTVTVTSNDGQNTKIVFNITVAQTAVIVTASDDEMIEGDSPPEITATYSPTLISPHPTTPPTCTTAATPSSNAGDYPSTCSDASDANYTFTYVAGTVTVTPARITAYCEPEHQIIDSGQEATVTAVAEGGDGDYQYWFTGSCHNPGIYDPSPTCTRTYYNHMLADAQYQVQLFHVIDGSGHELYGLAHPNDCWVRVRGGGVGDIGSPCVPPGNCIPPEICTGSPPVCTGTLSASCSVSPASGSSPLPAVYYAHPSGGNGTYTYTWTADAGTPGSCSGTGQTCSKTYTNATAAPISETSKLVVHSGTQVSAPDSCTATVNPAPASNPVLIASCYSDPNLVSVNTSTTFHPVGVSGGTPPYTYVWTDDAGNSDYSQNFLVTYSSATPATHIATVTVIDTDGKSASASCPVSITQPVSVASCYSDPNPVSVNESTAFQPVGVSGGTPPYTYSWTDDAGHSYSGSSQNFPVTYTSATPATHIAALIVTDNNGNSGNSVSCPVTVGQLYGCNGDKCQLGGTGNPCTVATQAVDCSPQNQPTCLTYDQKCSNSGDGWVSCTPGPAGDALCSNQLYGCNGDKCQLGGTGNSCTVATQAADCQNQPTCNTSTKTCINNGDSNISCIIGSPTQGDSFCADQSYGCNGDKCQLGGTGNPCATDDGCINQPTCDSSKVCMTGGDSNISCILCAAGNAYCAGQPPTPTQVDSIPPYQPLTAAPLTPETFGTDYCHGFVSFGWTYLDTAGNNEKSFEIQVSHDPNFGSGNIDFDYNSLSSSPNLDKPSGTVNNQSVFVKTSPEFESNKLSYNTTYSWRVKVYDSTGLDSGWVTAGQTFTTPLHAYPSPVLTVSPASAPLANNVDNVSFIDSSATIQSMCYKPGGTSYLCNAITQTDCTTYAAANGVTGCYEWWFNHINDTTPPDDFTIGGTSHPYTSVGNYSTWLQICDDVGCCSAPGSVTVKSPLNVPEWKEISPF